MGIGNTTAASALTAALLRLDPAEVTGRGTGIGDAALAAKIDVVRRAVEVNQPNPDDPVGVLAALGGLEIATLVGLILQAAASRIPVILDGFITAAAALIAAALCPALPPRLIAAHRSAEPGHAAILAHLELVPLLDLDLRLGEASGGVLALRLLDAACALRDEMATFTSAAISGPAA
jgi:nicotinate-nucleotide--dimethylbenzimidazole phosphoribosyltransferase